ncbi:hypothetical protein SAMN05443507_11953 [Alicyclobacillus tolerans]|uniref:Uncharacterized protein n=1 Tax=Alicyclobacillus tolerans TaxID=90970 RepID=A0A1M6UDV1_9BACL|nr:hypothetical protein SAMN05443507_11953 [Alicyclobacillus montanus]
MYHYVSVNSTDRLCRNCYLTIQTQFFIPKCHIVCFNAHILRVSVFTNHKTYYSNSKHVYNMFKVSFYSPIDSLYALL